MEPVVFQLEDLWQAAKTADRSERRTRHMVEMAKLLLTHAPSDATLVERLAAQPDDLTDLLVEYKAIGTLVQGILGQALPHIDAEFRGGPFEAQLQALEMQLGDLSARAETVREQNRRLLELEQTIRAQSAELAVLEAKVGELAHLEHELLALEAQRQQAGESTARLLERCAPLLAEGAQRMRAHAQADERIRAAQEGGGPDPTRVVAALAEAANLGRDIDTRLGEYDRAVRGVMTLQDEVIHHLRERQEPGGRQGV